MRKEYDDIINGFIEEYASADKENEEDNVKDGSLKDYILDNEALEKFLPSQDLKEKRIRD